MPDTFDEKLEKAIKSNPISSDLEEIISQILEIRDDLVKNSRTQQSFLDYTIEELQSYQFKLGVLRVTLGEFASKHQLVADYSYIHRKWSHASAWNPMKEYVTHSLGKVASNPDVEAAVALKIMSDLERETVSKGHANRLSTLLDTTWNLDNSIKTRISYLTSQMRSAGA